MAYSNLLASVLENSIVEFQNNGSNLQASKIVHVSHLTAHWIKIQPLGKTLGKAIDEGEIISPRISHPFRAPIWHNSKDVKSISQQLQLNWQCTIDEHGELLEDDWYKVEIEKVLDIFQQASNKNEAIVSFLDINNFDVENNRKMKIPIDLKQN